VGCRSGLDVLRGLSLVGNRIPDHPASAAMLIRLQINFNSNSNFNSNCSQNTQYHYCT